ncbi:DoxX family protein [Methylocapsa palsarum]|uniref:Putative oxidoreductase n=1 Tax=Methylocapsa palsarum TaxID=1612308 RepID=A0A1I3VTS5_9HYPH|nr:DoxX family protein [Methylocapsa palsarum]SFJ98824.1 putative oxidoreductase [Methylocapsa palsarum]
MTSIELKPVVALVGRILLALIFVLSGASKITSYGATAGFMVASGVPGVLLPLVIATELLGGLAVAFGWRARLAALLLAGFTLAAGVVFHSHFADQQQMISFMKNLAIAGGLLTLAAQGPGALSLDARAKR